MESICLSILTSRSFALFPDPMSMHGGLETGRPELQHSKLISSAINPVYILGPSMPSAFLSPLRAMKVAIRDLPLHSA